MFTRSSRTATKVWVLGGLCSLAAVCALASVGGYAQKVQFRAFHYDEAGVPPYMLPDPLRMNNGRPVTSATMWWRERRPQILQLFATQMFGETPAKRLPVRYGPVKIDRNALGGTAIREQVTVYFAAGKSEPAMHILLYLPRHATKPSPVFVGLNWSGNQAVAHDPGIDLNTLWVPDQGNRLRSHPETAAEASRGTDADQWQVARLINDGYGLATAYDGDIEPDFEGGMRYGVRALFLKPGQTAPSPDQWGALGAWAWGMSRILDWLNTNRAIDSGQVVLIGHSRLGKAALWAGAQDRRFAIVISNESGKGGAALLKRDYGETVEHLNVRFPYWFCRNFQRYSNHADLLPVDSPELLALIAPRPLYIGSAVPKFLDPEGEFLAAVAAGPVYQLLGKEGLDTTTMPPLNQPIMHQIGYHERSGKHEVTAWDWEQYLKFADTHFNRITVPNPAPLP